MYFQPLHFSALCVNLPIDNCLLERFEGHKVFSVHFVYMERILATSRCNYLLPVFWNVDMSSFLPGQLNMTKVSVIRKVAMSRDINL